MLRNLIYYMCGLNVNAINFCRVRHLKVAILSKRLMLEFEMYGYVWGCDPTQGCGFDLIRMLVVDHVDWNIRKADLLAGDFCWLIGHSKLILRKLIDVF